MQCESADAAVFPECPCGHLAELQMEKDSMAALPRFLGASILTIAARQPTH